MSGPLSWLTDQKLQDLGGKADELAATGNQGARVVALIVGQAAADEIDARRGRS